MIKTLPSDVQARLRSGVAIFSLQQCVEELILNSIDADATCVAVKIDMDACKVRVIDNGSGMCREDMERVGTRYSTSKCSTLEDLDNLRFYGFRGEAISSMISMAEVVEISSRTKLSVKTHVKKFNEGTGLEVFEAHAVRPSAGTTVSVYNLFHNMPVRRKRLDQVLETERIRQRVEAVSLVHPSVSFTVTKENSAHMMVQLSKASNTYYRFLQIHGLSRAQKLREVRYAHEQFEMAGYIGCEGHYNNSLQFLFVNGRLLLKTRIHKTLNALLKKACGTSRSNNSPTSSPLSPKQRPGSDLNAVYVLNIKCHYSEYDICLEPSKSLIEFKDWDNVLVCIEEGVGKFLTQENLQLESLSFSVIDEEGSDGQTTSPQTNARFPQAEQSLSGGIEVEIKDRFSNVYSSTSFEHPFGQALDTERATRSPDLSLWNNFPEASETFTHQEEFESAGCSDVNDNHRDLIHSATSHKITILNEKESQDSLKQFVVPYKASTSKRKLPFNEAGGDKHSHLFYGTSSKTFRPEPCRKLTLSFETGSLDKFKRFFGKDAEKKQSIVGIRTALDPESSSKSSDCSVACVETMEYMSSFQNDPAPLSKIGLVDISSPPKISLAAKCFYLKHRNAALASKPQPNNHQSSPDVAVNTESLHTSPRLPDCDQINPCELEKLHTILVSTTVDSEKDFPCLAVTEMNTKPPSVLEESHLGDKNVISSSADMTSQLDPLSNNTGNEGQANNEGSESSVAPGNWVSHYESSLGRLVYINTVTGLSKYDTPVMEETQVPCISDVTNVAVSVVSRTGFEYRCYPFQTDIVLPFLPKSRKERVLVSVKDNRDDVQDSNSLSTLLSEWSNPVFIRPPEVAIDVTSGLADGLAVKIHNILFPYRFTKNMIHSMKVINQVDKKFLACLINTTEQGNPETGFKDEGNLLVLVDQHAAHERVRLEGLITDSYKDDPDAPGGKRLCSSKVTPPLEISVTEEELRLLRSCQVFLKDFALNVSFPNTESQNVLLESLPTCFVEKESTEIRRGRRSVIKALAEDYLREHFELLRATGRVRGTLPLTVHSVLASQACHGAIKFNDSLSIKECCTLVSSLSSCQLPFQCAHGRPSIVPLADLNHLESEEELPKPNLRKLRRMYKSWQLYGQVESTSQITA